MGSSESNAKAVARLDEITRRLRVECPWDRRQDELSIVPHTVEEAYELADAVATGDDAKLIDELGDVLFQVHFLSLLLEERGAGNMATVAENCRQKLIRRHPHVFGDAEAETAAEVLDNWDRIKREIEGQEEEGVFADVPENLPALLYARKLQRRAVNRDPQERGGELPGDASAAFEEARSALDRLDEIARDRGPAEADSDQPNREDMREQFGRLLFAVVSAAREMDVDPELALRFQSDHFRRP